MNTDTDRVLLIFGYPLNFYHFGGLLWIKKVADYIEESHSLKVKKVNGYKSNKRHLFQWAAHLWAVLEGCLCRPNVSILDTYGEATLLMWILLRVFNPSAKIITIFHHYEPKSKRTTTNLLKALYYRLINCFTLIMLKNSDRIITVSRASSRQLSTLLGASISNKISIAGCSINWHNPEVLNTGFPRDLDFLCVGRLEKFDGLEEIWSMIKKKKPDAKFVIVGRASSKQILRLREAGIDHRGIVSEEEKFSLFAKAKVFIFPSMYEGFGMAVTEAFTAGLSVVAWDLPVFEERFGKNATDGIKLVEMGERKKFAEEALKALQSSSDTSYQILDRQDSIKSKTWDDIGQDVMSVIATMLSKRNCINFL